MNISGYRNDRLEPEPAPERINVRIARLAMRRVGDKWVAYIAALDTMNDAIEIGSVPVSDVLADQDLRESFLRHMKAKALQTLDPITAYPVEWAQK